MAKTQNEAIENLTEIIEAQREHILLLENKILLPNIIDETRLLEIGDNQQISNYGIRKDGDPGGENSIAFGVYNIKDLDDSDGIKEQGKDSIAIGIDAAKEKQGDNAIAVSTGISMNSISQPNNSIIISTGIVPDDDYGSTGVPESNPIPIENEILLETNENKLSIKNGNLYVNGWRYMNGAGVATELSMYVEKNNIFKEYLDKYVTLQRLVKTDDSIAVNSTAISNIIVHGKIITPGKVRNLTFLDEAGTVATREYVDEQIIDNISNGISKKEAEDLIYASVNPVEVKTNNNKTVVDMLINQQTIVFPSNQQITFLDKAGTVATQEYVDNHVPVIAPDESKADRDFKNVNFSGKEGKILQVGENGAIDFMDLPSGGGTGTTEGKFGDGSLTTDQSGVGYSKTEMDTIDSSKANKDLSNVLAPLGSQQKFIKVNDDLKLEYVDAPSGGGSGTVDAYSKVESDAKFETKQDALDSISDINNVVKAITVANHEKYLGNYATLDELKNVHTHPDDGEFGFVGSGTTWDEWAHIIPSDSVGGVWTQVGSGAKNGASVSEDVLWNQRTSSEQDALAAGTDAGKTNQGADSIAIGKQAGSSNQGYKSVAIGLEAGNNFQSNFSVAIGAGAGSNIQADSAVAIGNNSGSGNQRSNSIAIGVQSGQTSQGENTTSPAGVSKTIGYAISIGTRAGWKEQGLSSIAIGKDAGNIHQKEESIAIGEKSGYDSQGADSIAIGFSSGNDTQGDKAIAIGQEAGNLTQGLSSIAIGQEAGRNRQAAASIAIGRRAGWSNLGDDSVAIGNQAGHLASSRYSVAIGGFAGQNGQNEGAIAIGYLAAGHGNTDLLTKAEHQGENSIAIGRQAAPLLQGENSIAIGYLVAADSSTPTISQPAKSIVIGAGSELVNYQNNNIINAENEGDIVIQTVETSNNNDNKLEIKNNGELWINGKQVKLEFV